MSYDKFLDIDLGVPTPEEFTKELMKTKPDAELALATIEEYSRWYHERYMRVMAETDKPAE